MSKLLDFIKPAGDDETEVIKFDGPAKKLKPTWCKVCGRRHSRNDACDLVEYQQGDEYEKMVFSEEAGRDRLKTLRHPGRWRPNYEQTENASE